MKNTGIKMLFIALMAGAISCTNLDEEPVGLLAPEGFFKSKQDVQTAIFGVNGALAHESLYGRAYVCNMLLRDDMCDIGNRSTATYRIQINDFGANSTNQWMGQIWQQSYLAISCANTAEAGAISLGLPDAEINPLIGEARFLRAFCYFNLVRVFGDLPYIDYPVSNPESVKTLSKTSEADVYKAIIADLEFAKQWLPNKQTSDCRTRPSKGTAASYLASVYLTKKDYQKAYTEAKYVIDNKDQFGYQLETDYQNIFRADKTSTLKEIIFAIDFLGAINQGSYNDDLIVPMMYPRDINAGFGVVVPSMKTYESFNDLDYRKKVNFDTEVRNPSTGLMVPYTSWKEPRPHIAKWSRYPGNTGAGFRYSDHNYIDMRYAEVLLIAAESLAETNGPNTEAEGYVNLVRSRARNAAGVVGTYPENIQTGLAKTVFIDQVLEERRIELAFEWKRWYDIKRRNLGDLAFKGPNSTEPHATFDATRDYLFPIPKTELDVNPNLGPQNTGY
jgi:starch-binding outer membrane protein, SusD/RagB family